MKKIKTALQLIMLVLFTACAVNVYASETTTTVKFEIFSVHLNYATRIKAISFSSSMTPEAIFEQGFKTESGYKYFDAVLSPDVKILGIEITDKLVVVNFNTAFVNTNLGHGPEFSMLTAIGNTIGNYYGVGEVQINVEGEPYKSGHGISSLIKVKPFKDITMSSEEISLSDGTKSYTYLFADGKTNPKIDQPVLLINGVFTSAYDVILMNGNAYVPLELFSGKFGAFTEWNRINNEVTILYGDTTIVMSTAGTNGMENKSAQPEIIGGKLYVPVRFVCEQLGLTVGYIPSFEEGQGIAYNSVVWIDYIKEPSVKEIESLTLKLREKLNAELDKIGESLKGSVNESEFKYLYPLVKVIISNISCTGRAGRYAVYNGPYTLLVDLETQELFIVYNEGSRAAIIKEDMSILKLITG